ncbi:RHS repeat-associated core domain-containing protein [Hydrogenophaga luteola]|uniref:RHS repeat-associated core domain-containing protein n=2 Tax=Hydrogenophaga luteola TaxID=1591122 RepID=A0ABV7W272_9BURK
MGNPIMPATAEKLRQEQDMALPEPHSIPLVRTYRSSRVGASTATLRTLDSGTTVSMGSGSSGGGSSGMSAFTAYTEPSHSIVGKGWSINLVSRLHFNQSVYQGYARPYWLGWANVRLGDGKYRVFAPSSSSADGWIPMGGHKDRLYPLTPGPTTQTSLFVYQPADSDDKYVFALAPAEEINPGLGYTAYLQQIQHRNGWATRFEVDPNSPPREPRPIKVTNHFGHAFGFAYSTTGELVSVTQLSPTGQVVGVTTYQYETDNRLGTITLPDGAVQRLHHEDSNNPLWLTGYSKNGQRIATYRYDERGRAVETTRANGADRFLMDYSASTLTAQTGAYNSVNVIDPLGTVRNYGYRIAGKQLVVSAASHPPMDPEAHAVKNRGTSSDGLITSETTFRNSSTSWGYDYTRRLPTSISEGSQTRTRTIAWHPTFRLPTQIDETGGKRTTFAYDDKGNLLQKTVTATTGTPVNEVWTWTYNAQGLMATETDPRGSVTTFAYNSHGQLVRMTNALGQVTTYAYSPAGLVSQINEPDGLVRRMTYTPRGWLATSTLSAGGVHLATAYTYTVDGQIRSAALPSGHTITYHYDAALRNTGWSDNRGQSATYTLDPAGNATDEQVRNSGGALALQIRRTISALNRVQSETWGSGVTETYTQDANGRLASVTDALSKTTTYGRDGLDRINRVTDATSRAATITYNAQDAVTQVVDFKYIITNYTRDVQGNARTEATADAGTTTSTYDALGLPSRIVDAMGRASAITRDALGRPTLITHTASGGKTLTTTLRYDLAGTACDAPGHPSAAIGRLCEMVDQQDGPNGLFTLATTQYQWDSFGRLTRQTQTLSSAIAYLTTVQTTAFSHVASGAGQGELASITYPSGSVLTHQYSASGRLSGLLWNGQPLIENLQYNALGQPLSWSWAFGQSSGFRLPASRQYNTAGQLTATEFASFTPDATGRVTALTQKLLRSNGSGGWVEESVPFTALYNALGQLTSFTATGASPVFQWGHTYTYDNNANRTGGTITANGASMSFTNGVQSYSNRQTDAAGITVTSNAAGDITSLLGKTLAYDTAGRLSQATGVPPCPGGVNCSGLQTTTSRYNGWGQRFLRENDLEQSVFSYGLEGFTLLSQTTRRLATSQQSTTEHIWLPTASGPLPIAAVIDGVHYAVHADHLNTPRRLSDASGQTRWQWPYSGFGEIAPQATPAAGQAPLSFALRYPGQIDDGNELFYNWHRFYEPRVGRYTKADPIGLEGGWNRFGYVGGDPLGFVDSNGLQPVIPVPVPAPPVTPPGSPSESPGYTPVPDLFKPSPLLPTWNWDGITWPNWMPSWSPKPGHSWPTFPPSRPNGTPDADKESRDKCYAAYIAQVEVCKMTSTTLKAREACYSRAANVYAECLKKGC